MRSTFTIKLKKTNLIGRFFILEIQLLLELIFIIFEKLRSDIQTNPSKILWKSADEE